MIPNNPLKQITDPLGGPLSETHLGAIVILLMMVAVYMFLRSRTVWHTATAIIIGGLAAYLTLAITGYPSFLANLIVSVTHFGRSALHALGVL